MWLGVFFFGAAFGAGAGPGVAAGGSGVGGSGSSRNVVLAGVASVWLERSVARTANVRAPLRGAGDEHGANAPPSREHSKVVSGSLAENSTRSPAMAPIVVSGAARSSSAKPPVRRRPTETKAPPAYTCVPSE